MIRNILTEEEKREALKLQRQKQLPVRELVEAISANPSMPTLSRKERRKREAIVLKTLRPKHLKGFRP